MMLEDEFGSATVRFWAIELVPPQISRVSIAQLLTLSITADRVGIKKNFFNFLIFFMCESSINFYFEVWLKKFFLFDAVLAVVRVWEQMDVISKISQYLLKKWEKV
jgi:hypothetical protein